MVGLSRFGAAPQAIVVVPARDEEAWIGACLEALAAQTVGVSAFEVIVVIDACRDATATVARATATRLGLTLKLLQGQGAGAGAARRLGMDAAAETFAYLRRPGGLIATTDADTAPAPDWLERQLAHLVDGACVVAGLIKLEGGDAARLPQAVIDRRCADAQARLQAVRAQNPEAEHHHFAGASLGITAETYRRVGGIEAVPALEDEHFALRLREHRIQILRPADVVVHTAARTVGRVGRGLSVDLAVSVWRESRRYRAEEFEDLNPGGDGTAGVTVVIPTKDCAGTIEGVLQRTVRPLVDRGLVDRALVIDAGSCDGTRSVARRAGADVVQQDEVLTDFGPAAGKGDAMWRAVHLCACDVICFLDGDTEDPVPEHLLGLLGPMLCCPDLQLVKGAFDRPLRAGGTVLADEGGRVTELTARPLLNLHFPLLAGFAQPLAGEFAARRELLERLPFPVGYGVEIALLIDALGLCGLAGLAESHLGTRQNQHQSLRSLGEMSFAVLAAVERRLSGPRAVTTGQYLRPWADGSHVRVPVAERPPLRSIEMAPSRLEADDLVQAKKQ